MLRCLSPGQRTFGTLIPFLRSTRTTGFADLSRSCPSLIVSMQAFCCSIEDSFAAAKSVRRLRWLTSPHASKGRAHTTELTHRTSACGEALFLIQSENKKIKDCRIPAVRKEQDHLRNRELMSRHKKDQRRRPRELSSLPTSRK